jgi:hypothetical protein
MLGLQPRPTVIEAIVYVAFAVPLLLYVLWPSSWKLAFRRRSEASMAFEQAT